jgi:hypothetical protein
MTPHVAPFSAISLAPVGGPVYGEAFGKNIGAYPASVQPAKVAPG